MPKNKITNEPITLTDEEFELVKNQLVNQIAGKMGFRVGWMIIRWPLVFFAGMWFSKFLDWFLDKTFMK